MVGVLSVDARDRPTQCVLLLFTLLKGALSPHQEVQVGVSDGSSSSGTVRAVDTAESEDPVRFVCVGDIELVAGVLSAKDELVLAHQQGYIILQGKSIVVELGDGVGSTADGELAGSGHLQAVELTLPEINPEIVRVDVVGSVSAVVATPQQRHVSRVHHLRIDRVCLSKGKGLHPLRVP